MPVFANRADQGVWPEYRDSLFWGLVLGLNRTLPWANVWG